MNYLVAYTLKQEQELGPDTFQDHYKTFLAFDGHTLDSAKEYYKQMVETDGGKDGWSLYTASLTQIIDSTDY